jgi:AcrR family transcriptional regulator
LARGITAVNRSQRNAWEDRRKARLTQLPRGRHRLPREFVAANQRERLIAAMAEVSADVGYANTSVADVVDYSAVSRATFYKQFTDRRDCMLGAFNYYFDRLLLEIGSVCTSAAPWEATLSGAVEKVLALFAEDPPAARLLTVEILAAGPAGTERYHAAIDLLADMLRGGRARCSQPVTLPPSTEWALVASMALLIAKRLVDGGAESLPQLREELVQIALTPYLAARSPAQSSLVAHDGVTEAA